jgi:hypothetical protein
LLGSEARRFGRWWRVRNSVPFRPGLSDQLGSAQDAAASSLIREKAAAVFRCARLLKQASEIGDALDLIEIVDLLQDFVGALGR